jgi:hypothetical protein
MTTKHWGIIAVAGLALTYVFHFGWFKDNQHIALWLEGVALVAIFGLDFFERNAQHVETLEQMKISRDQTQAATDAANAATKSAAISAAVTRPLMGISNFQVLGDINRRTWDFNIVFKNFGTLPAYDVCVMTELFIDDSLRHTYGGDEAIEIFPSDNVEHNIDFVFDADEVGLVPSGKKTLTVKVTINYRTDDGRKFEYSALGRYKQQRIDVTKTGTREVK